MYEGIIQSYVDNLKKEDLPRFLASYQVTLSNDEVDLIFHMIKEKWRVFYKGNPEQELRELKQGLTKEHYQLFLEQYQKYRK